MDYGVKSVNQSGGITAGIINVSQTKKNKKKVHIITIIMLALATLTFFGVDQMFKKDIIANESYNVQSHNQSGGITAGKIETLNLFTDKESLGIRDPKGLYQDGTKVGTVIDFQADDSSNTFTIKEIEFDKPIRDSNSIWMPYEYQIYVIKINHIDSLVYLMPPGARGVKGIILEERTANP